jgi:hypothetical protein
LPVLEATQQEESQHAEQQQRTYNSVLLYSVFNPSTVRAVSVLAAIDTVYAAALQLAKAHASLYSLCMPTVQTKQQFKKQFKKQFNNKSNNNSTTIQQQFNNNSTSVNDIGLPNTRYLPTTNPQTITKQTTKQTIAHDERMPYFIAAPVFSALAPLTAITNCTSGSTATVLKCFVGQYSHLFNSFLVHDMIACTQKGQEKRKCARERGYVRKSMQTRKSVQEKERVCK